MSEQLHLFLILWVSCFCILINQFIIMIPKKKYMTYEEFTRILRRQKASNLSITDFCHNEGFHRSKFYKW